MKTILLISLWLISCSHNEFEGCEKIVAHNESGRRLIEFESAVWGGGTPSTYFYYFEDGRPFLKVVPSYDFPDYFRKIGFDLSGKLVFSTSNTDAEISILHNNDNSVNLQVNLLHGESFLNQPQKSIDWTCVSIIKKSF